MSDVRLYLFTGPVISFIVAFAFLLAWLHQRERHYVLFFVVSFFTYALAALSQMLHIPPDGGQNMMVSAIIYTFAILCLVEGVLARFGRSGTGFVLFGLSAAILALLYYFYYVDRSLVARIYIQNFGYGLMFLVAAVQIGIAKRRPLVDWIILWVFALFGLHFFVRTILTMSSSARIWELDRLGAGGMDRDVLIAFFRESPFWQILNFSILVSGFLIAIVLLAAVAIDVIDDLRREGREDILTGLANRRGFEVQAAALFADRSSHPLSAVYCDIDHFKTINDTYGHAAGDRVIQAFATLIAGETGPHDVAARLGGEEFVVLLSRSNKVGAARFAERVRTDLEFAHFTALPLHVGITASFGVAEWRPGEDLSSLLQRADLMVYAAKQAGRNRLNVDDEALNKASSHPRSPRPMRGDGGVG